MGRLFVSLALVAMAASAQAAIVGGGGSSTTDCMVVFDVPGANNPAPPKAPKHVDCTDGDPSCDADGQRNGECVFDLRVCVNSSSFLDCNPEEVVEILVDHAEDNGDPRFDVDMQALQQRADSLGLPSVSIDACAAATSSVTVRLRGPKPNQKMRPAKKKMKVASAGTVAGRFTRDTDKMKFTCRPQGDSVYLPTDLFEGTFDRIRQQVFAQSCALSGCHDSETVSGGLNLLPNSAYANLVGVAPVNGVAAGAGLSRIDAGGDPTTSFLYRKITADLEAGWGAPMPLLGPDVSSQLQEIIRLWIAGDGITGPAPETGWVTGTDQ